MIKPKSDLWCVVLFALLEIAIMTDGSHQLHISPFVTVPAFLFVGCITGYLFAAWLKWRDEWIQRNNK